MYRIRHPWIPITLVAATAVMLTALVAWDTWRAKPLSSQQKNERARAELVTAVPAGWTVETVNVGLHSDMGYVEFFASDVAGRPVRVMVGYDPDLAWSATVTDFHPLPEAGYTAVFRESPGGELALERTIGHATPDWAASVRPLAVTAVRLVRATQRSD